MAVFLKEFYKKFAHEYEEWPEVPGRKQPIRGLVKVHPGCPKCVDHRRLQAN